jgi:hypothetical protein
VSLIDWVKQKIKDLPFVPENQERTDALRDITEKKPVNIKEKK